MEATLSALSLNPITTKSHFSNADIVVQDIKLICIIVLYFQYYFVIKSLYLQIDHNKFSIKVKFGSLLSEVIKILYAFAFQPQFYVDVCNIYLEPVFIYFYYYYLFVLNLFKF